ncbi:helix-turn-helix domain-containing protein [Companilactobacillus sp. FL22-1]|uniref:helix-turn-helix domain-containing protein n=1 Tax=Companilactobacillus sp. FL22-1 TaxID=3373892 RepID=UPI0037547452
MREVADKNMDRLMHESGFNIASNLKQLRRERNVTQKEVAQHLNIDVTTLSHYETGIRMPDIDTLIALAKYYDIDINRMVSSEDN